MHTDCTGGVPYVYKYSPQLKALASCSLEPPESHPNLKRRAESPLQLAAWSAALRSHPDLEYVGYLLSGIQHGFRIGYSYESTQSQSAKGNLPSAKEHPQIISKYLSTEVAKDRILGPFPACAIPKTELGSSPKSLHRGNGGLSQTLRRECQ